MGIVNITNRHIPKGCYIQFAVTLLINSTMFTCGLQTGWISPMSKTLQSDISPAGRPLSNYEISLLASLFCLFGIIGTPFYSYAADRFGRKTGAILVAIPQLISWLLKIFMPNLAGLIIARSCCGMSAGGCFNIDPMYTKEISQDNIRGVLGSLVMLTQNIGLLAMYAMGSYLDYNTAMWIVLGYSTVTLLMMFTLPESPAYLVKRGKIKRARKVLSFLRGLEPGDKTIEEELDALKKEEEYYQSLPDISFFAIFKNQAWRRSFFLAFTMITFQASNGIYAIIAYASMILASTGVTISIELQTLSIPVVMIIGSFVSMSCVEVFGRKPLFAIMMAISTISFVCMGIILHVNAQGSNVPSWLPAFAIVIGVFAYSGGILPIPYIVMSETFNFQVRSKLMGCIVTTAWIQELIQLAAFAPVSNYLGKHVTFYYFALVNFFGFLYALLFVPETKGKSIEQIEEEMSKT